MPPAELVERQSDLIERHEVSSMAVRSEARPNAGRAANLVLFV